MDMLLLENQLCFPLYVASKEIIRKYKEFLDPLDLTYTQYIVMMVLWEEEVINVKHLGEKVYLDSGTLTPLLKKLESHEYVKRIRDKNDERNVFIHLTNKGKELKNKAKYVPINMCNCIDLTKEEIQILQKLLYKLFKSEE
jgi:DNA-binding MarR family transcriptional regulator